MLNTMLDWFLPWPFLSAVWSFSELRPLRAVWAARPTTILIRPLCEHDPQRRNDANVLAEMSEIVVLQSLRDRLSLSVLEDGSRKAERLENFLVTSNSTVQKFLYWDFLANILPSRFLLPMPTVTTYRATTVTLNLPAAVLRNCWVHGVGHADERISRKSRGASGAPP